MFILYRDIGQDNNQEWQAVGYFFEFPEAVCAMEEEIRKKDGIRMKIEQEEENASKNAM